MKATQLRDQDVVAVGNHKQGFNGPCHKAVVVGSAHKGHKVTVAFENNNTGEWMPQEVASQSIIGTWEEYQAHVAAQEAANQRTREEFTVAQGKLNAYLAERGQPEIAVNGNLTVTLTVPELCRYLGVEL